MQSLVVLFVGSATLVADDLYMLIYMSMRVVAVAQLHDPCFHLEQHVGAHCVGASLPLILRVVEAPWHSLPIHLFSHSY